MVIGFVGLGIMGKPMAKNLCRAGYTLIVNDHHKENVDELVQAGARSGDLKQIGTESDVVITMLPNSPQVKDVMLGENGIAGYMKKGTFCPARTDCPRPPWPASATGRSPPGASPACGSLRARPARCSRPRP